MHPSEGACTVGFENVINRYDKTKIQVVSGDLSAGFWSLDGFTLVRSSSCCGGSSATPERIALQGALTKLVVKDLGQSHSTASIIGAGVGALAGLRFYGLVGAIGGAFAGHFLGGSRAEVSAEAELSDGRKFVATMDPSIFKRLAAIANRAD